MSSKELCDYCNKVLSAEKLETEHGCLDCAGWIYRNPENRQWYCAHCIEGENKKLQSENAKLKAKLDKAVKALRVSVAATEFFCGHADCKTDRWACACSFCKPNDHSRNMRDARQILREIEG